VLIIDVAGELARAIAERLARSRIAVQMVGAILEMAPPLAAWDFDVALLDAELPEDGAADVCRKVRAASRACSVLVWTEVEDPLEAVCCYHAGADDYFGKRQDQLVIEAKIRRGVLRARERIQSGFEDLQPARPRNVGGPAQHDAPSVDARQLTRLEERLLATLSGAPGELVRSEEIITHVWGHSRVENRALYEHVSTLRAKLQALGWTIVNVRGQGYKLTREEPRLASGRARSGFLAVSQDSAAESWQSVG
jgi:DNA-binding response OmpR family regulator